MKNRLCSFLVSYLTFEDVFCWCWFGHLTDTLLWCHFIVPVRVQWAGTKSGALVYNCDQDNMTFDFNSLCDPELKKKKKKQTIWQPYGLCCRREKNEACIKCQSFAQSIDQGQMFSEITANFPWFPLPLIYQLYQKILWVCMLFECIYPPPPLFSSGRQPLRVREHKVLGPYVDGLSRLAVASYKVKYLCAFPHREKLEQKYYMFFGLQHYKLFYNTDML